MADISKIKLDSTVYNIKDATAARASALEDKLDALTAGDGIAIDNNDTIRTTGIPFGRCDSTSTSKVFTATVPGIYKLEDGVCAMIENGVVTSVAEFTLNVNGLGAKPCYSNLAAATRDTTIFNVAYTMLFVYDEERVEGGCWVCYRGYDSNTNTIGYLVRSNSHSLPASLKFYRYRLLFTSADGTHYVPANTSSSTNATASRTVNQTPIDPFGHIVYYGTTAAVEANARPAASALWIIYTLALGYSFNKTGAALELNDWAPVYIKCAPQANGSAIIDADTPYVQALPTTNDGKIYIFLGIAYSTTSVELLNNHPVYYHDGTGIRLWTGKKASTKFVVNFTYENGGYICDKTNAEIYAAWQEGREVIATDGDFVCPLTEIPSSTRATFGTMEYDDLTTYLLYTIVTSGDTQTVYFSSESYLTYSSPCADITTTDISNWNSKQSALVSGTNIKTINNESLLGSGNISIQGGSDSPNIEYNSSKTALVIGGGSTKYTISLSDGDSICSSVEINDFTYSKSRFPLEINSGDILNVVVNTRSGTCTTTMGGTTVSTSTSFSIQSVSGNIAITVAAPGGPSGPGGDGPIVVP